AELEKVKASVDGPRGRLRGADAGKIGERADKISNKYKVAKHFTLLIADGAFAYERKAEQINSEASLDGLYAICPPPPAVTLGAPAAVRAYKQLKMAERAFGTMKDTIEIRPIHHHLETRVRAHVFLCMLAYYVSFELQTRLPELLFTDDTPLAQADPVKPATRSAPAHNKAATPPPPTPPPPTPPPAPPRPQRGPQRHHHQRVPRPHPHRPPRRPRHPVPQHRPHRPRRAHLHPPHHTHATTSRRPRTTRRQTPRVAKAKPARNTRIPRHHAGFNLSNAKTSG